MTRIPPQPPPQVYRGDRFRLNYSAGTILVLLHDYEKPRTDEQLFNALNRHNTDAGIPGGEAGTQWTPPAPKPLKTFKKPSEAPAPANTYTSTIDSDTDVPALGPNDHDDAPDVEYYPDLIREHCTYFEADITRVRTILRMLAYTGLVTLDGNSATITELGSAVVAKMRAVEDAARADAKDTLTPTQQYLLGDARDKDGTHKIPFTVLPLSITQAVYTASQFDDMDAVTVESYDSAITLGVQSPQAMVDVDTEDAQFDNDLPIRQSLHRHFSYRQFLQLLHENRNVFVLAYAGPSEEAARIVGTRSNLGDAATVAADPMLQKIKKARAICKRTSTFVDMVLSGGPEGNWLGKPLRPADVHNDVVAYTAAGRSGFNERIMQGSSMAWETFDNLRLCVGDLERAREALYTAIGHGLVGQQDAGPIPDVDPDDAVAAAGAPTNATPVEASKHVYRTADLALADMGIDIETTPVAGDRRSVVCNHIFRTRNPSTGVETARRCAGKAIGGSGWCEQHGGTYLTPEETESMVRASQQKLFAGTSKAVEVMLTLMLHSTNDSVRLRAAEQVLNRGGLSESRDITVNVKDDTEKSPSDKIMDRLAQLGGGAQKAVEANNGVGNDVIVDAEVVESD